MKKGHTTILRTAFLSLAAILFLPGIAAAHAGDGDGDTLGPASGFGMMRMVEDRALGDELHEEMESLMVKMMTGALTDAEADRMVSFMEEHPGPHGMMMGRIAGNYAWGGRTGEMRNGSFVPPLGMMGYGGGLWPAAAVLYGIVWFVVGVLAIAWLWHGITKMK